MSILALYCSVDECWQQFAPWWQRQVLAWGARQRLRPRHLHPSEIIEVDPLWWLIREVGEWSAASPKEAGSQRAA